MRNIDDHHNHTLHILQSTIQNTNWFLLLQQSIILLTLKLNRTLSFFLHSLQQLLLPLLQKTHQLISKYKFTLYFRFSIIQLRRLFLDRIGYWWFLFEHLVDYTAGFGDVGMVALDLCCAVCHAIDWLVYDDCCMRFLHDFIDLMTFCTNKQRHHSFRHKNNDRKCLLFIFFKRLVNVTQHSLWALILLFHLNIVNLHQTAITCIFLPFRSGIVKSELNPICSTPCVLASLWNHS